MRRWIVLSMLAATVIASPAVAGDASCLWRAIPEANRTQFLAAAADHLVSPAEFAAFVDTLDEELARATCKIKPGDQTAAGGSLTGYVMRMSGVTWLNHTTSPPPTSWKKPGK